MTCPLCNENINDKVLFQTKCHISAGKLNNIPLEYLENYEKKRGGLTNISLVQCNNCGYVYNKNFNFELIKKEYTSNNYFSRKIISNSMSDIIKNLRDKILSFNKKNYLEIAPGSGDLAASLAINANAYYTIDPSIVSLEIQRIDNIFHIQNFFDYNLIKNKFKHNIDFIIFRHLLEHIDKPYIFLQDICKIANNNTIIYIEVPNLTEILKHNRFYEFFNDHCGYYQKNTLVNTMNIFGFTLFDEIYPYREQHMGLFFKKNETICESKHPIQLYENFHFEFYINKLNEMLLNYKNIAIYGAGAHGNSLINFLSNKNKQKIQKCFDLDERKQGKFLQFSNAEIEKPNIENLKNIDCIVIAAPLYEQEIIKYLRNSGYNKDIIATETEIKILE